MKAEAIIKKLNLIAHPEGGYYSETYRSEEFYNPESLPHRYQGVRTFSTLIYFLLREDQVSLFHRLLSDEVWHFYLGSPIILHTIDENGVYNQKNIGSKVLEDESPQVIIKRNTWFAAELKDKSQFSLVGCTVAPGFEYRDFELGRRDDLIKIYPQHSGLISKFSK
ncbi:MAG: cupin domain-containing protein [Melioribacteraceae bacterium]|jgi:predicted cupin superfamily sugar epimerase|nr:cupin domain-containing protein [Melioribacteraceae bacterium]